MKRRRFADENLRLGHRHADFQCPQLDENLWRRVALEVSASRQFASTQVLSSMDNGRVHEKSPLFQSFCLLAGVPQKEETTNLESSSRALLVDELDDPCNSRLSSGHHIRYHQLTSEIKSGRRDNKEQKELRSLNQLVREEQEAYKKATANFFNKHKRRFLEGFTSKSSPAFPFCSWASSQNLRRNINIKIPMTYEKSCQSISIQSSGDTFTDIEQLGKFKVIELPKHSINSAFTKSGLFRPILPPSTSGVPEISALRDDTTGRKLALENNAQVLTTSEILEALLLMPGEPLTRWIIHLSNAPSGDLVLLDSHVAQSFLSPRECYTAGVEEAFYQAYAKTDDIEPPPIQFAYSLWELPTSQFHRKQREVRILVRIPVRVQNGSTPVHFRCHVEYFPSRGVECLCSYERAVLVLWKLLLNHTTETRLIRWNAVDCTVISNEEISVAHAFCGAEKNPLQHFSGLFQVLRSVPVLDTRGSSILRLEPTELSATVHKATLQKASFDLNHVLKQSDSVLLGDTAILHSVCQWEWTKSGQIPHTFPPK